MLSPSAVAKSLASIDLCLADINVRIEGPERLVGVLAFTLANVPRFSASGTPDLTYSVAPSEDAWEISGRGGSLQFLAGQTALPRVGGAVTNAAIAGAAALRNATTMRASVVEKNGRALAMVGDDWESAIALSTHLHRRGWTYIGADNVLLDAATREVSCIQKSLYVMSSSVSQLPTSYRRAVEASPWYLTPQGISFYAVDPSDAVTGEAWTPTATLSGLIVVDGGIADNPSIEALDDERFCDERLARFGLDWRHVNAADLRMGSCIDTCDLIEHWFG